MAEVAIVRCESYEQREVDAAVHRGLELIGGLRSFVKPGEKILLKPNMLSADPPEKCVTTHPAVFKAAALALQKAGVQLSYGDSPGFGSPEGVARKSGIAAVAAELGIPLADFHQGQEAVCAQALQNKKFTIAQGVLASEGLISLPKLKTHGLTRMTGCIKNQFGCIPGFLKGEYHVKLPEVSHFAQMLVDLNVLLQPRLFIMDGIIAMEGNGPRGGRPKKMNVLLFSSDPVALDAVVCRMVGVIPETVSTIQAGMKSGLGTCLEQDINLLGDVLEAFADSTFDINRGSNHNQRRIPQSKLLREILLSKPCIIESGCVKCGVCIKVCPVIPKVLAWPQGDQERPPVYDYDRCIRCFCCQELCPESTIIIKKTRLRRWVDKIHA
ncbi:MAG TPA: DUF362 domain-containing protein [Syntrophomonas sp.]|mgnify:CR=1 FL=1|nr:DUF362 domain-containing protein [Syntrophomonas sp.]